MGEAVVRVERVQAAEGNKPFKLFDGNGVDYGTFDEAIAAKTTGLVGKQVTITFTEKDTVKNGRTYHNRYLDKIEEAAGESAAQSGSSDAMSKDEWAAKDLRINRCAIWKAIVPVAMQAGVSMFTKQNDGKYDDGQLAAFVSRFGRTLRMIAEADIYLEEPVDSPDDWIPFELKETT